MDIPVCGPASFALAAVSLLLLFRDIHQAAYVNSLVRIGARWCELSRYVPEFPRVFPRITAFFFRWERSLFLSSIDRSSHLMIAVYRVTVNHMPLHRRDDDTNLLDLWENA